MWSWQLVFLIHEEKITRFQIIFIHQFITLRNFSFKMSINFFLNCERYEVRVKSFFCFFIKKYMLHCRCCLWWGRNDVEFFLKEGFSYSWKRQWSFFNLLSHCWYCLWWGGNDVEVFLKKGGLFFNVHGSGIEVFFNVHGSGNEVFLKSGYSCFI